MKILIVFISVFFLSFSICISQPYCTWQNPLPTRSGLNDIYFSDSLNGYSVGINGTVLKTTNSGYNWSSINYYKSINLSSVSFLNSSTGIIVGSEYYTSGGGGLRSEIIRTTN